MDYNDGFTSQFNYISAFSSVARKKVKKKTQVFFVKKTVESQNQTVVAVLSNRMHHVLSVENVKPLGMQKNLFISLTKILLTGWRVIN